MYIYTTTKHYYDVYMYIEIDSVTVTDIKLLLQVYNGH